MFSVCENTNLKKKWWIWRHASSPLSYRTDGPFALATYKPMLAYFTARRGYLLMTGEQKECVIVSNLIHQPPTACVHIYKPTHILKSSIRHSLGNIGDCRSINKISNNPLSYSVSNMHFLWVTPATDAPMLNIKNAFSIFCFFDYFPRSTTSCI